MEQFLGKLFYDNQVSGLSLISFYNVTRMHSSRMRTIHCSGRLLGEGCGGVCLGRGCLPGGVCLGGICLGSVYLGGGWCLPRAGIHLCPVNRMTDTCENITFTQLLLWMVTRQHVDTIQSVVVFFQST